MVVRIAGERMYLWRAVDHEGEVLDMLVQRRRDTRAALRLMRKLLKKQGFAPKLLITDKLRSYAAAFRRLRLTCPHEQGLRMNLPVQMPVHPLRPRHASIFKKSEPRQRSQDAGLHRAGPQVPCRLQHPDDRNRAEARQYFSIQPIVCRGDQRPKNDTHIALGPRVDRVPIKIAEVQVPECDVKQKGLQGSMPLLG